MHRYCTSFCYLLEDTLMLEVITPEDQAGSQAYGTWSSKGRSSFPRSKKITRTCGGWVEEVGEEGLQFSCGPTLPCIHVMIDVWKEKGIRNQATICTVTIPNVFSVMALHVLLQKLWLKPTSPATRQAHRKRFDKNPL